MSDRTDARQRIEHVPGSRRARLTPAPGTDPDPETGVPGADAAAPHESADPGPNDARLRREVPPHY